MTSHPGRASTCAVVPVKSLARAKQRLSGMLSICERRNLSLAMLFDVITTLKRADGLETVAVLSCDTDVIDLARALDVRILPDTGMCVNATVAEAARLLSTEGCETMLVVPADVPLATPAEFNRILGSQKTESPVTLVPDQRGTGTNVLACSPPTAIAPCFGQRSLIRHQEAARGAGFTASILELPGLGLDIDIPDDVLALTAQQRQSRTHDYLSGILGDARPVTENHPGAAPGTWTCSQDKSG